MLAEGPQGVEGAEPPEHSPQRGWHVGLVRVLVEPAHDRELQERQGQGPAVVHLQPHSARVRGGHTGACAPAAPGGEGTASRGWAAPLGKGRQEHKPACSSCSGPRAQRPRSAQRYLGPV